MSAWGTGLYQDDTALDIRDTIKKEVGPEMKLYENTKSSYSLLNEIHLQ